MNTISEEISTRHEMLSSAITEFNVEVEKLWDGILAKLQAYNTAVDRANEFQTAVSDSILEYVDERSEKWQDSEAGARYSAWMEEWTDDLDTIEEGSLDKPEEVQIPDSVEEEFNGRPTSVGDV